MIKKGDILEWVDPSGAGSRSLRIMDEVFPVGGTQEKWWTRAVPVCKANSGDDMDRMRCNACECHCPDRELFVKYYSGSEPEIRNAMKNQGKITLCSPYIVKNYGYGEEKDGQGAFVVMEYVHGVSLGTYLNQQAEQDAGQMTEDDLRKWRLKKYRLMLPMLFGVMDYQNGQDTKDGAVGVHMDLKPDNFLVVLDGKGNEEKVMLTDFEGYVRTGSVMDTFLYSPGYAHPEQIQAFLEEGMPIQSRPYWDLYALAVVFYEFLDEHAFFDEAERQERAAAPYSVKKPATFTNRAARLPEEERKALEELLVRMMNADDLGISIQDVYYDFRQFLQRFLSVSERCELLARERPGDEEEALAARPYLRVSIKVSAAEDFSQSETKARSYPPVILNFLLYQGTLVPLYYGENICGTDFQRAEDEYGEELLLGYLLESGGRACFFPMKEGMEPVWLERGGRLSFVELALEVLSVEGQQTAGPGTQQRTRAGRRTHGI